MTTYAVSIDVGGTFTDVFARVVETGEVMIRKVPSSPANPALAILDGIRALEVDPARIVSLTHGTTVATNALVTRSFPRTALLTTRGFRDTLEIGTSTKPDLWDAYVDVSPPYIPRRDRLEVTERVTFDGTVRISLDEDGVRDIAETIRRRGITSVGVVFINAYANGVHERRAAEILRDELPGVLVCTSSEVLPEMFEFPRTSTTATNAVLGPVVDEYMTELTRGLRRLGYEGDVLVLHSGGGVMSAATVTAFAARIAASGPAGGAAAMAHIAGQSGFAAAIGFDVGGTTSDISVAVDGEVRVTKDWGVEYGHPIAFPSIDLVTIGAGGGSIAWLDGANALRCGPESAGAVPGPAAYCTGGTRPTTTDANLVLGRLGTSLVGGGMTLDVEASRSAIREAIAEPLGLSVEEAADAILRVSTANMTEAIRLVSIERGLDPRDFALVAFGGGGPLHGVDVAREASIPTVIIPEHPGVTSAVGCSIVDIEHDLTRTLILPADVDATAPLAAAFDELVEAGRERLESDRAHARGTSIRRYVDMRYQGQWRTITIRADEGDVDAAALATLFHRQHEREFGYALVDQPVEISGIRVSAIAFVGAPTLDVTSTDEAAPAPGPPSAIGERDVWDSDAKLFAPVPRFARSGLRPGHRLTGPFIVEQLDTTTYVPAGCTALVEPHGAIVVTIGEKR